MDHLLSEKHRAWIYRVSMYVIPMLVVYGALESSKASMWLNLVGAILGAGTNILASANTSTKSQNDSEVVTPSP